MVHPPRSRCSRSVYSASIIGAIGALAVATSSWGSAGGVAASRAREVRYIKAAAKEADRSDRSCSAVALGAFRQGSPSRKLLSILSVLRRPVTPADSLSKLPLARSLMHGHGVYARYIRLARVVSGRAYYLWPAAYATAPPTLPLRCAHEQARELRRDLSHIPVVLRGPTLQLQSRTLRREERRQPGTKQAQEGLFELDTPVDGSGGPGNGPGGGTSGGASQITMGGYLGSVATGQQSVTHGVVPDGVGTVTFSYPAGPPTPHGKQILPAVSVTDRPVGNVFVINAPRGAPTQLTPTITWRATTGTIIKTFHSS